MFDKCLYYNMTALNRRISRVWQDEFAKIELSPSVGYLLFALVEDKTLSQKGLSELLVLDQSTMTRFIDTLVAKGFVKKDGKGKGSTLTVTALGKKKYKMICSSMDSLYKQMQKKIGAKQFSKFVTELQQVKSIFKES